MDELSLKLETYTFLHQNSIVLGPKKAVIKPKVKAKVSKTVKPVEVLDRSTVSPLSCVDSSLHDATSSQKFYLTTAINYTNGLPHVGHAYEAITSDIIVRYHRLFGRKTFFLTGTDEHGQKVEQSALAQGKTPKQVCDFYADRFKQLDEQLAVKFDRFIRTTDAQHEENCKALWEIVQSKGDIYLKDYEGWYDVHSERYVTDLEAKQSDFKDEHGRPFERKKEESYFFRMSNYQERLLAHIKENPNFIQPSSRQNEITSFLKEPLHDLCISRTVCQWGVKTPIDPEYKGDKSHVMYVWFDALTNYLSGINFFNSPGTPEEASLKEFWPVNVHVIGKDIIRFHCVIWPCMLLAAGIDLPRCVFGHGFVNDKDGVKMSKSLGNVVDPTEMLKKYDVDCFRFYLAQETTYGTDLAFNEEAMKSLYNSFLSSAFGNLVHRSTSLCKSYCKGVVPDVEPLNDLPFDLDELRTKFEVAFSVSGGFQIHSAAEALVIAVNSSNKFLQDAAPWKIKGDDAEAVARRSEIVRTSLEAVYILSHFLLPFCPVKVESVFHKLGVESTQISKLNSNFKNLPSGTSTYIGEVLYQTIETGVEVEPKTDAKSSKKESQKKQSKAAAQKKPKQNAKKTEAAETVDSPFYKVDIRVGKILEAWHHPDADGLFCEKIDVGEETPRLIASGLRKHYEVADLVNRKVLVVCNLKPANLKGFKSQGMVLCAAIKNVEDEKVEFCDPPAESEIGERVFIEGSELEEPASANQVAKKKLFVKAAGVMKTDGNGEATFDGRKIMTKAGVCKAKSLKEAPLC